MEPKLGILAGGGGLPGRLIEACRERKRDVFVVAFEGAADPGPISSVPHEWVRLGAVGQTIDLLHRSGSQEVVLAGPVRRPSLTSLRPDGRGLRLLSRLAGGSLGDDRLLTLVVSELEGEGFRVVGVDDILADLLALPGPIGRHRPDANALSDIELGARVARSLGAHDVGQAVVVQQGVVIGVEAVEGTDAMLARCAGLLQDGSGGVLVKVKKPDQERRADLPCIGPQTVRACSEAGIRGITVEARGALIIERPLVAATADAANLFVVGVEIP